MNHAVQKTRGRIDKLVTPSRVLKLSRFLGLLAFLVWVATLGYLYTIGIDRTLLAVGQGGIAFAAYEEQLDSNFFLCTPAPSIRWWIDVSTRIEDEPKKSRLSVFVPLWPGLMVFLVSWILLKSKTHASPAQPASENESNWPKRLHIGSVALCIGLLATLIGALGNLQEYLDPKRYYSRVERPLLYFPSLAFRVLPSVEMAIERGKFSVSYKQESDYGWGSSTTCSTTVLGVAFCRHARTVPLTTVLSPALFDPPNDLRARINAGRPGITGWTIKISLLIWGGAIAAAIIMVRGRRALCRRRRARDGLCLACGYDLRESVSAICTECGSPNRNRSPDDSTI